MKISFKTFDYLSEESIKIRTDVFVIEQGFIDEFDENDNKSIHVLMYDENTAIGTCRIIYSNEHNSIAIGRFAIVKEYRRKHLGQALMKEAEKIIIKKYGHIRVGVGAQERAENFYKSVGFIPTNEKYVEQDCPHIWMLKEL